MTTLNSSRHPLLSASGLGTRCHAPPNPGPCLGDPDVVECLLHRAAATWISLSAAGLGHRSSRTSHVPMPDDASPALQRANLWLVPVRPGRLKKKATGQWNSRVPHRSSPRSSRPAPPDVCPLRLPRPPERPVSPRDPPSTPPGAADRGPTRTRHPVASASLTRRIYHPFGLVCAYPVGRGCGAGSSIHSNRSPVADIAVPARSFIPAAFSRRC